MIHITSYYPDPYGPSSAKSKNLRVERLRPLALLLNRSLKRSQACEIPDYRRNSTSQDDFLHGSNTGYSHVSFMQPWY